MLRVFEAFAGYGSQSIALRNLGIEHEVVAISEIDKYAIKAYEAIHGPTNNLGDICKIDPNDIPDHDLFTYSFPCQDLSVAGKQAGLGKGTRSGLLYECEKIIEHCRPKYLLLENVKNLVGKKFKPEFDKWLEYLEGLGYTNYWQMLNAKHYGVPQNRERVFVISILGEHKPYESPKPISLDKCIADVLEDEVDEKYYVSKDIQDKFRPNKNIKDTIDSPVRLGGLFDTDKSKHQAGSVWDTEKISPTLDTMQGGWRQPCVMDAINVVGKLDCKGWHDIETRVYDTNGVSPTIETRNRGKYLTGQDHDRQSKILEHKIYQNVKVRKYDVDIDELKKTLKDAKNKSGLTIKDISSKLDVSKTTVEHWFRSDNCFSIPDENIWLDLKNLLGITTDKFDKSIMEFEIKPNEYDMSNRVYHENGIAPTLTASGESGAKKIIGRDYRIRKLTPRECFRLMGMSDDDIDKIQAAEISNTQQYKMAGNSIVVNVLEAIFKNLFMEG